MQSWCMTNSANQSISLSRQEEVIINQLKQFCESSADG